MSFLFLINTVARYATTQIVAGAALATGYDQRDMMSGPRSAYVRSVPGLFHSTYLQCDPSAVGATHVVIARADKLKTRNGTMMTALTYGGLALTSRTDFDAMFTDTVTSSLNQRASVVGVAPTPDATINAADRRQIAYVYRGGGTMTLAHTLLGPHGQDFVYAFPARQVAYTYGLSLTSAVTQAFEYSKFYVCDSFDIGVHPEFGASWVDIPQGEPSMFTPIKGTFPYATEQQITLAFNNVTKANAEIFKALPHLLDWPLFLYDSDSAVWEWQLEHVLIESFEETISEIDQHNFAITFRRLRHYE